MLAVLLLPAALLADAPDAVVTFNEIHYNPPSTQDAEWIELHNQMAVNVDLSGWSLADGVSYSFPPGTVIPGRGFLVIAKTPGNIPGSLGPYDGNLSNSGETIDLLSSSGRLMDRLEYADTGDWPLAADGAGVTLAKRRPGLSAANPAHWRASLQPGGTPGAHNFPDPGAPPVHHLVDAASRWRFDDSGTPPPENWRDPGFDDSSWQEGPPLFGTVGDPPSLEITNHLVARYRAGAVDGVADGSTFTTWPDTATGDGVAQDATAGGDPRFAENATPSGRPAVSFDGNDEFRTSLSPGIPSNSGFVYFVVCKATSTPANGAINDGAGSYILDRDHSASDPPLVSLKVVNGRYGFQKRQNNNNGLGGPVSTTSVSATDFQIVAIRRNRGAGRFEIWVDGVLEASTNDNGANLTPQPVVIGRHATETSNGFPGQIAEILIYRDALSDDDLMKVGAYLEAEYGLDTAFPDIYNIQTPLSAPNASFRRTFEFTGDPSRSVLSLDHTVADGAVFYLNGQEIARANMPEGPVDHATPALSDIPDPVSSGFLTVPSSALVTGTNVLAVSLHSAAGDDTNLFGARLRAVETPADPDESPPLHLNEIAASHADPFFIEIINPHPAPVSTHGFVLSSPGGEMPLPAATLPPGGVLHFTEEQLGFRPASGARILLLAPGGGISDIQLADSVARGRSGVWPGRWLRTSAPTPGGANTFALQHGIVINELCYHPPDLDPASPDREWLELYNRGDSSVDLGGWRFGSGITYTFPGVTLPPGGYLVLAKNPALSGIPGALGPYSGSLSNSGETILLLDAAGNPADEVAYLDGGRWPGAADGEGSSLELRDPRADNSLPESWAASDESARRSWQTYTYRATASPSAVGPDGQWHEFVFGLLDSGDILIDDISVIENPDTTAVPMIANGDFESGTTGWRFLGTHRHATLVPDPDAPSNTVLHLSAKGPAEHMHNHIETTLANGEQVANGREYEISFRARWLSGSHRLNTRLYFNRCAKTTELHRTGSPGTPGAPNSAAVPNLGPGFHAFSHHPVVPAPDEEVTVSARVADPDGIGTLTLHYSVDGPPFTSIPMTAAGDGEHFSAIIPGQPAASVVRFHITATDAAEVPATSYFPAAGPDSHALWQVNDGLAAANGLHNLRIVMDPADRELLHRPNNVMSNERLGGTLIYNESEVYYDIGVRLKSSQRGRPVASRVGFNIGFNRDQLFRGVHRTIAIDRSEGQQVGCQEILYDHMMYASGSVPAEYNDLCKVIAPDPAHTSHAILQLARFGDVFLDSQFPTGSDGTVYEYELVYYPTTTDAEGYKLPQPDNVVGTHIRDLGDDQENYRWTFLLKNNEDRDDYSRIIATAKLFGKSSAAFEAEVAGIIDIDQWLRALACSCATGAGDSFFANANHNGQFYARPSDGRVLYFPHDMDFSYDATRNIYQNSELQKLVQNPIRRRAYLGHLHHLCTTVFNQSYMSAWTAHYGGLLPGENFSGHLSYINTRSNYILTAIHTEIPSVAFAITTNGGANFSTSASPAILAGKGWVNVDRIRLAGAAQPLETAWTSTNDWEIRIPLAPGPNVIALEALDRSGAVVGTDSIVVTHTGTTLLPDAGSLVISEIYYNPPGSDESTEYLELLNTSAATLDLSGLSFTAGITATIPPGTLLAPGARALVVKDPAAFAAVFGPGLPVVASYPNNLDNAGERLELRRADGAVIHNFSYSDQPPWPVEADGDGYSLVLVDPWSAPDHGDPRSWRASALPDGGTPGASDTQSYAGWKAAHGNHNDDEDLDGDGFTTRQEYFLGGDPNVADPALAPAFTPEPGGTLLLSVTRRAAAESSALVVESSTDLIGWNPETNALLLANQRLPGSPALDRLTFRVTPPPGEPKYFVRFAFGP